MVICGSTTICSKSIKQTSGTSSSRTYWCFVSTQKELLNSCLWAEKYIYLLHRIWVEWESRMMSLGERKGTLEHPALLNLNSCLRQILWYSKWVSSVQIRFQTELLTALDRGEISCLTTKAFANSEAAWKSCGGCGQEETGQDCLGMGPFPC